MMKEMSIGQALIGAILSAVGFCLIWLGFGMFVVYLFNSSSVDDCNRERELYGMETRIYEHNCYIKIDGRWKRYTTEYRLSQE